MFQLAKLSSKYKTLVGYWPTNSLSLAAVMSITDPSVLQDGWGNPFAFSTDSPGTTLFIISHGADGKPQGAAAEDRDITWILDKPIP